MKAQIREFFPGGNTPVGFHSYYNYILPQKEAEKIFCIKGGPGVGKSTLMKEIAEHFIQKEEDTDIFWCSADPHSLDGVLINNRHVAVLDGTAPHVIDPINPGAIDEIVDLGEFFDSKKLKSKKDEIIDCSSNISEIYKAAYTYLGSAAVLYRKMEDMIDIHLIDDKFIERTCILDDLEKTNNRGNIKKLYGSAISSEGIISCLPVIADTLNKIYLLDVPIGCDTSHIIGMISGRAIKSGFDVIQLYCPMDPYNKVEHIIVPEAGFGVFTCNDHHGRELYEDKYQAESLNIRIEYKPHTISIHEKMTVDSKRLIANAIELLHEAKILHDELESYYIENMDFEEIQSIKEYIISTIEAS